MWRKRHPRSDSLSLGCALGLLLGMATEAQAVAFVVDSTADATDAIPGDGACDDGGGACTLRAAIQETNALAGADTITLPAGTYTLSIPGKAEDAAATGDLDVVDDLVLTGSGALTTVIDAAGIDRVLHILSEPIVAIADVTLTGGGGVSFGGGLLSHTSTTTLTNAIIDSNASTNNGGGMGCNVNGDVTLKSSTVTNNSAASRGGGIYLFGLCVLTVVNSTISTNSAADGGGLMVAGNANAALINTTVSNNAATSSGGGLKAAGAGILSQRHTIVAGNTAPSNADCDGAPTFPLLGFNLVGSSTGCLVGANDLTINPADVFTTLLGPLADNGGPTPTHALLAGGLAVDAGDPIDGCKDEFGTLLTEDQRGRPRPRDGDTDGTAVCDPGAFEFGIAAVPSLPPAGLALLVAVLATFAGWERARLRGAPGPWSAAGGTTGSARRTPRPTAAPRT